MNLSFKILPLLLLLILPSCTLVRLNKVEVRGVVYDSESQKPVKDALVKVDISKPSDTIEAVTDDQGHFFIYSSGSLVLSEDFIDEDDFIKRARKLTVTLNHPEFSEDIYEEELEAVSAELKQVDVGAFYLSSKEKEDFLKYLQEQSELKIDQNSSHDQSSVLSEGNELEDSNE